jgi:hypothetical protein
MAYVFEPLNTDGDDWYRKIDDYQLGTIYQTPAWLKFLSNTQNGLPVVARLKDGHTTMGYFTGLVVKKFGVRILGSPFPGWTTGYMGLTLSPHASRSRAVEALIELAFQQLGCAHLEIMDRNISACDLQGLDIQYRVYRGFEVDLTQDEDKLFGNMTSACRRCIRKARKNGVSIEEACDLRFADEYFSQLQDVFAKQSLVPMYGINRVRQLIRIVYPAGHLMLLRARDMRGRCIATGLFPHANGVMHFWGGASWRDSQHLRPNEALQWYAMKVGKQMGIQTYDMGGSGDYKRKYGGKEIVVPWIRKSKYEWIPHIRNLAQRLYSVKQWVLGQSTILRKPSAQHAIYETQ